eukprot:8612411-Lingulodinium_polyedra.AAC.1
MASSPRWRPATAGCYLANTARRPHSRTTAGGERGVILQGETSPPGTPAGSPTHDLPRHWPN